MDTQYFFYLLIDRHPIIAILTMAVMFCWANSLARKHKIREIKGDRKAILPNTLFELCGIMAMVAVFSIATNHWDSITGQQPTVTHDHGHRYDIVSIDTLLHSPFCGCKRQNHYIPSATEDAAHDSTNARNRTGQQKQI